jgi:hypothetical protein
VPIKAGWQAQYIRSRGHVGTCVSYYKFDRYARRKWAPTGAETFADLEFKLDELATLDTHLLKRAKKFQPEDSNVAQNLLATNASGYRRSLIRYKARGRGRRRGNREMNSLAQS